MKFLENDKLAQITALMTDAKVGTGECVINGRIEAFTMKRAGTDKKLAHALGEKYQAEIQVLETELAEFQKTLEKKRRSQSLGNELDNALSSKRKLPPMPNRAPPSPNSNKRVRIDLSGQPPTSRRRSNSMPVAGAHNAKRKVAVTSAMRARSDSFDAKSAPTLPALPFSNSPLGDFHNSCTQRLMTDLILTLNSSFPDYDFSNIRPSHFARLPSSSVAVNRTNEKLSELAASSQQGTNFLPQLWNSIDDVIGLNDSEVYSYVPPQLDDDDDPLGFLTQTLDGTDSDSIVPLWTFNFFFVNKTMKRIVLFTCVQTMRNDAVSSSDDEDDGYFYGSYLASEENVSFDRYEVANSYHGNRRARLLFQSGDDDDDDDEEDNVRDFDMDLDGIGRAAPSATVT